MMERGRRNGIELVRLAKHPQPRPYIWVEIQGHDDDETGGTLFKYEWMDVIDRGPAGLIYGDLSHAGSGFLYNNFEDRKLLDPDGSAAADGVEWLPMADGAVVRAFYDDLYESWFTEVPVVRKAGAQSLLVAQITASGAGGFPRSYRAKIYDPLSDAVIGTDMALVNENEANYSNLDDLAIPLRTGQRVIAWRRTNELRCAAHQVEPVLHVVKIAGPGLAGNGEITFPVSYLCYVYDWVNGRWDETPRALHNYAEDQHLTGLDEGGNYPIDSWKVLYRAMPVGTILHAFWEPGNLRFGASVRHNRYEFLLPWRVSGNSGAIGADYTLQLVHPNGILGGGAVFNGRNEAELNYPAELAAGFARLPVGMIVNGYPSYDTGKVVFNLPWPVNSDLCT